MNYEEMKKHREHYQIIKRRWNERPRRRNRINKLLDEVEMLETLTKQQLRKMIKESME